MRSGRRIGRWTAAAVAGLLGTVLAAGPGLAARTIHVGPNPRGAGTCAAPKFNKIQKAIKVADPGDTILVCPGTYAEQLSIVGGEKRDLTLKATKPGQAIVQTPAGIDPGDAVLLIERARRVTVRGLRFEQGQAGSCTRPLDTIRAFRAADVRIQANRLPRPEAGCFPDYGIRLVLSSGVVKGNRINDFFIAGVISLGNPPGPIAVTRNIVSQWVIGTPFGHSLIGTGIQVLTASTEEITVSGNRVEGLEAAAPPEDPPALMAAIEVDAPNALVRDNTARYADVGLSVAKGAGVSVVGNDARDNFTTDCRTDGNGKGWVDNLGDPAKSTPSAICSLP